MLQGISREWQVPIWLAVLDFQKAFDTIEHAKLWAVLDEIGVDEHYIAILQRLYAEQVATVAAGVQSRPSNLQRGVKQGDPISGLLVIVVMEICFRELKARWAELNRKG